MNEVTCWTLLEDAAGGDDRARDEFVRRYLPLVRECLRRRWQGNALRLELDDAIQEVFVECLRKDGVLDRLFANRVPQFRRFFFGVVKNVARRTEARIARVPDPPLAETFDGDAIAADDPRLSQIFDRIWMQRLLSEAAERHRTWARDAGGDAWQRFELLRLHFQQELTISEIARQWSIKAPNLHYTFQSALKDFQAALTETVRFHNPGAPELVRREVEEVMRSL